MLAETVISDVENTKQVCQAKSREREKKKDWLYREKDFLNLNPLTGWLILHITWHWKQVGREKADYLNMENVGCAQEVNLMLRLILIH